MVTIHPSAGQSRTPRPREAAKLEPVGWNRTSVSRLQGGGPATGRYRHWGEHRGSSPNLRLHRATCTAGTPCSPLSLLDRDMLQCPPLNTRHFANPFATRTGTGGRNRTLIRGFGDPVDVHVTPIDGFRPRIRTWNDEINSLAPLPTGTAGNWSVVRGSNPHLRFGRPRQLPKLLTTQTGVRPSDRTTFNGSSNRRYDHIS